MSGGQSKERRKVMSQGVTKINAHQLEWNTMPGGWKYKILGKGGKFLTAMGVAEPGGGETWHKHTADCEETYYVLRGKGRISWRSEGKEYSLDFTEGDCLYLPFGMENMFVNRGTEELEMMFNISNVPKMRE
jgi:mannose-6-phosphate isomerase-like protein (cupin superfamily)